MCVLPVRAVTKPACPAVQRGQNINVATVTYNNHVNNGIPTVDTKSAVVFCLDGYKTAAGMASGSVSCSNGVWQSQVDCLSPPGGTCPPLTISDATVDYDTDQDEGDTPTAQTKQASVTCSYRFLSEDGSG